MSMRLLETAGSSGWELIASTSMQHYQHVWDGFCAGPGMASVADEKAWLGDNPGGDFEPNHSGQHAGKTSALASH